MNSKGCARWFLVASTIFAARTEILLQVPGVASLLGVCYKPGSTIDWRTYSPTLANLSHDNTLCLKAHAPKAGHRHAPDPEAEPNTKTPKTTQTPGYERPYPNLARWKQASACSTLANAYAKG